MKYADGLSPVQERFAVFLARGHTQSEAYRLANPKSRHWKNKTVHHNACDLAALPQIRQRVEALREMFAQHAIWSREESVRALRGVIENPERKSDIIAAVRELNAMHGFHAPQRLEHSGAIVAIERRIIDVVVAEDVAAKALPGRASEDDARLATALPYELPEASRPQS